LTITASGWVFIPAGLLLFFRAPKQLCVWLVLVSVFAAASVIDIGTEGFPAGVSPYYFTALLIALRAMPKWLNGGLTFRRGDPVRPYLLVMAVFTGWASLSAFLFPLLFRGLPVDLARAGPDMTYYSRLPLHFSFSNAGQAGYLILNFIVITYFASHAAKPGHAKALAGAFSWSGVIALTVGAYQLLAHMTGLPFPDSLINSNPAWAHLAGQHLNGVWRISASFDEASGAGAFFATWTVFELVLSLSRDRSRSRHQFLALAGSLMVIGTTSTTGYVTLLTMVVLTVSSELLASFRKTRPTTPVLIAAAIAIIAITGAFLLTGDGSSLLRAVLWDKSQSNSSVHRLATVGRSIDIFTSTCGFGAGLGSNRAMSLIAYILSNLGAPGTVLFAWLLISLRAITRAVMSKVPKDATSRILLRAVAWAFATHLLAMSESAAEISDPSLWILWAILIVQIRQHWLSSTPVPGLRSPCVPVSTLPTWFQQPAAD